MFFLADKAVSFDIYHIAILLVLLFGLWLAASWYFGCGVLPIPGACDTFWGITRFSTGGKANVLIVYGDGGLGDHELLEKTLSSSASFIAPAKSLHLSQVTTGNLKNYDVVIVEEARQIASEDLRMFIDYVNAGGRLVWTGDAGTVTEKGDRLLYEYERPNGTDENRVTSPWARKTGNKVLAFDDFLSVSFVGNFCELKNCSSVPFIGILEAPSREHDLVKAIRPDLRMYGDFSIVEIRPNSYSTTVLTVDALADIFADKEIYSTTNPVNTFPTTPQCSDQKDNDGDGLIDFTGLDLDQDGQPEYQPDPGCFGPSDNFEAGAQSTSGGPDTECDDGQDNDGDGKKDYPADECCLSTHWDDESTCLTGTTECSDGRDNDNDLKSDFPADNGCYSASDPSEGRSNLGKIFPIIVTSTAGQKVAYYAIPPEFFVSDQMPIDPETGQRITYRALIENMYYGMIR